MNNKEICVVHTEIWVVYINFHPFPFFNSTSALQNYYEKVKQYLLFIDKLLAIRTFYTKKKALEIIIIRDRKEGNQSLLYNFELIITIELI